MMNAMLRETLVTRHRHQGGSRGLAGCRQDRHVAGFPRRLVRRLHAAPGHRRLARQRRQFIDQEDDRRRPAGRDLEPLHEGRASGRSGRRIAGRCAAALRRRRRRPSAAAAPPRPGARSGRRRPTACRSIAGSSTSCSAAVDPHDCHGLLCSSRTRRDIVQMSKARHPMWRSAPRSATRCCRACDRRPRRGSRRRSAARSRSATRRRRRDRETA